MQRVVLVALLLVVPLSCGEEENPGAPGGGTLGDCPTVANGASSVSDVVFNGDRYDYDLIPQGTDPRAHPLFAGIWGRLQVQAGVQCWQQQNGTNNLQFFENPAFGPGPRYRFAGTIDTEVGALLVHSVGCYFAANGGQAYHAAAVITYTGELELLVVVSGNAIDHFIGYQGNFPLITRYVATAANCL